jgi:hypothetical protein
VFFVADDRTTRLLSAASYQRPACKITGSGCLRAAAMGKWAQLSTSNQKEDTMATGETGFDDVTFDLISLQYHSLKAGHDYGQYVRDAKNAGLDDVASFMEDVMAQDSQRAQRCHELLAQLQGSSQSGAAVN